MPMMQLQSAVTSNVDTCVNDVESLFNDLKALAGGDMTKILTLPTEVQSAISDCTAAGDDVKQCLMNDVAPVVSDLKSIIMDHDILKIPQAISDVQKALTDCKKLIPSMPMMQLQSAVTSNVD